ncbi:MAG: hypothetical protein GXP53_02850 [Deltaproteobacteria bacterium]|nr:hypothetical protein [Deltaproteobacteria bacterium]
MIYRHAWLCIIISLLLCFSSHCYGGKLESFENDATTHREDNEKTDHHYFNTEDSEDTDDFLSDVAGFVTIGILGGMTLGGVSSWKRVCPSGDTEISDATPRKAGEPLIPFFRADISRQNLESDVNALDFRAEVGYGPFALHYNQTRFHENEPKDKLDLIRIYGVYRMSFSTLVELDLGLGTLIINGKNENSGFSFTLPFIIRPVKYVGVEFRPAWSSVNGTDVNDYDIAIMLGEKYASLKLGYRWLHSVEESLNGPYAGVSLYF